MLTPFPLPPFPPFPVKMAPAVMFSVYYVSVTFFDAILSDWALHLLRLKNNRWVLLRLNVDVGSAPVPK